MIVMVRGAAMWPPIKTWTKCRWCQMRIESPQLTAAAILVCVRHSRSSRNLPAVQQRLVIPHKQSAKREGFLGKLSKHSADSQGVSLAGTKVSLPRCHQVASATHTALMLSTGTTGEQQQAKVQHAAHSSCADNPGCSRAKRSRHDCIHIVLEVAAEQ